MSLRGFAELEFVAKAENIVFQPVEQIEIGNAISTLVSFSHPSMHGVSDLPSVRAVAAAAGDRPEWRIRRANLRAVGAGDLPIAGQPGVKRKQIRGFAELEFIAKAENIVFQGKQDRISL